MRIGVVSDVHGNLSALNAVIKDLERVGVDLVVNGGDLVGSGARPTEVIDRVAALPWCHVVGNTDEVLWRPGPLAALSVSMPALERTWRIVFQDVERTRSALGAERIGWLRSLPTQWTESDIMIVHATPGDVWNAPAPESADADFIRAYGGRQSVVVYGHVHIPFIRRFADFTAANAGSVGMPFDGDPRASYLVLDALKPTIHRVEYDVDAEVTALRQCNHPASDWMAAVLRSGRYVPPP